MTGKIDRIEVITSVKRRRGWSAEEKARIVQETYVPGMSVSLVARQHGIASWAASSNTRVNRSEARKIVCDYPKSCIDVIDPQKGIVLAHKRGYTQKKP
jgi:hypothetical protein